MFIEQVDGELCTLFRVKSDHICVLVRVYVCEDHQVLVGQILKTDVNFKKTLWRLVPKHLLAEGREVEQGIGTLMRCSTSLGSDRTSAK